MEGAMGSEARIFQGSETRQVHATKGTQAKADGWYWEPADYDGDVLWSEAFGSEAEAREAAADDRLSPVAVAAAALGRAGKGAAKRRTTIVYRCSECGELVDSSSTDPDVHMFCPEHPQATINSCPEPAAYYRALRAKRQARYLVSAEGVEQWEETAAVTQRGAQRIADKLARERGWQGRRFVGERMGEGATERVERVAVRHPGEQWQEYLA